MPVIRASCPNPAPCLHNSFIISFRGLFSKFCTPITLPMPYCNLSKSFIPAQITVIDKVACHSKNRPLIYRAHIIYGIVVCRRNTRGTEKRIYANLQWQCDEFQELFCNFAPIKLSCDEL